MERGVGGATLALYLEQPYVVIRPWWKIWRRPLQPGFGEALRGHLAEAPRWVVVTASKEDRDAKLRASRAYASQLPLISRISFLPRMRRYEDARGGETVAVLSSTNARS